MKIKKDDLAQITMDAIRISNATLALLAATQCPIAECYEEIEGFVAKVDALRESLELPKLSPSEVKNHLLSRVFSRPEPKKKKPIGFSY